MLRNASLLVLLSAAACAPTAPPPPPAPLPPAPAAPAPTNLIGRDPQAVIELMGSPTLDRSEGPARHLQFARGACVLDVYFYPGKRDPAPVATHVEARTPDGRSYDSAACITALRAG